MLLGYMEDPDITTPPRPAASAPGRRRLPRARCPRPLDESNELPGGEVNTNSNYRLPLGVTVHVITSMAHYS